MSKRDYYEVLGVDRGVNKADLKKAYRRLAMKHQIQQVVAVSAAEQTSTIFSVMCLVTFSAVVAGAGDRVFIAAMISNITLK